MTRTPPAAGRVVVRTDSAAETRALAARLAMVAASGDRLALLGPLGAGKTEFAKGFALGLGVTEIVNSPTFTLMAEYSGRLPLFHLDLYRLEDAAQAIEAGLLDEREAAGITLLEWGDRLGSEVDPERLEVRIAVAPDESRSIEIRAGSPAHERFLRAAQDVQSA